MKTEGILRAASIIDPIGSNAFEGNLTEALDVMVTYADTWAARSGDAAQTDLTSVLRNSDPDRVAEVAAAALLRLARLSRLATDTAAEYEAIGADTHGRLMRGVAFAAGPTGGDR